MGEWREEKPGESTIGEKWVEKFKKDDNYWEKKSEKYTLYSKKQIDALNDFAIEEVLNAPRILRSG